MTPSPIIQALVEEWRKVRTDAISDMFDHPRQLSGKMGIYPTTKFFNVVDTWFYTALSRLEREVQEEAMVLAEEMKLESDYFYSKKSAIEALSDFAVRLTQKP